MLGPPSSPPGPARPTHLRGLQPHPHLPHQEGLQAAARCAEEAGARCRPGIGISGPRRHGSSGRALAAQGSRGLERATRSRALRGRRSGVVGGWSQSPSPAPPAGSAGEGQGIWAWPQESHLVKLLTTSPRRHLEGFRIIGGKNVIDHLMYLTYFSD